MIAGVTLMEFLKPNPHALTNGATVMSNAPSVSLDTCCATSNTSVKYVFNVVSTLWLIRVMMELGL